MNGRAPALRRFMYLENTKATEEDFFEAQMLILKEIRDILSIISTCENDQMKRKDCASTKTSLAAIVRIGTLSKMDH